MVLGKIPLWLTLTVLVVGLILFTIFSPLFGFNHNRSVDAISIIGMVMAVVAIFLLAYHHLVPWIDEKLSKADSD